MITKSIKKVRKVIDILDIHILNILKKEDIDESRLETLTSIRSDYVEELNSLNKSKNTSDMYFKKK